MSTRTAGKMGMKDVQPDDRDLLFSRFRQPEQITVPDTFGGDDGLSEFYMFGNGPESPPPDGAPEGFEGCGDCFFAGSAEEHRMWSAFGLSKADEFTTLDVLSDYGSTGFDLSKTEPNGENPTDEGTEPREGLKYRQSPGIIDASKERHPIGLYIAGEAKSFEQMLELALICDGVGLGYNIPGTAQQQFSNHEPWDVVEGEEIEGGHWVPFRKRVSATVFTVITWGGEQEVTQAFFEKNNTAVFGIFSVESLKDGKNPDGLDMAGVLAAAKELGVEVVQPAA